MTENEAIIREKISDFEMHYAEFDKYPKNIESDFVEAVSSLLQEIQQYRAIGTVEEFKALKEKNEPKKPRFYAHNYHCIECGNLVGNNEFEWQRFLYCDNCGTKIDWQ